MDTSDPEIFFDEKGFCNHCINYYENQGKILNDNINKKKIYSLIKTIKENKKNSNYDSIIGLSGGVDSSYMILKLHELGLNPLVVHVDAGWNTEGAVKNIENLIHYTKFDLKTYIVEWEEMKDLALAYLKSGVSNQDTPQDHLFTSVLFYYAKKEKIKFIFSGGNIATESVLPSSWQHAVMDSINLKAIHKRFGSKLLKTYKTTSFFEYYFYYPFVKQIRVIRLLNFYEYNKSKALKELVEKVNYKTYDKKHGESKFTKFFQNYILPKKFGYDKRKAHLSSLILNKQISRAEAVNQIKKPLYKKDELEIDKYFFCKKLGIEENFFENFMAKPRRKNNEFENWNKWIRLLKLIQKIISHFVEIKKYS